MSRRFAIRWTVSCLVLTALGLGAMVWAWPGEADARALPGEGGPRGVAVASVVGQVEVRRAGGAWEALAPGRELATGDEIRTGEFSETILRGDDGASLGLTPNTTFVIGEEGPRIARFTLGVGKVAAEIHSEERTYEFGAGTGDAKADTRGGAFSLVADGDGLLGVVTRRGQVGLSAKGKRVVVDAGRQAVAQADAAPTDPLPIPEAVFLQVKWPGRETDLAMVALEGRTDVGARVRIAGAPVEVGPDGVFRAEIPLSEGENSVVVLAEDAAGNVERTVSPVIVREPESPSLKVKTNGSIWE